MGFFLFPLSKIISWVLPSPLSGSIVVIKTGTERMMFSFNVKNEMEEIFRYHPVNSAGWHKHFISTEKWDSFGFSGKSVMMMSWHENDEQSPSLALGVSLPVFLEELQKSSSGPIMISGNEDFVNKARMNGWPGNGTSDNPYIIENLVIVTNQWATNGIHIENTDVYFIIRNCTITTSGDGWPPTYPSGIYLSNVYNAVLMNNTALGCKGFGYYLSGVHDTMLINNTALQNNQGGYFLSWSSNATLINNTAHGNVHHGFFLDSSINLTLITNRAINNSDTGYYLKSSSNNTLMENIAVFNALGFELEDSSNHDVLLGNIVHDNLGSFFLLYSQYNRLESNKIYQNEYDAILLSYSGHNDLINNTLQSGGISIWTTSVESAVQGQVIGNTVAGNPIKFFQHSRGIVIGGTKDVGQIIVVNASSIILQQCHITGSINGIQLWFTNDSVICENIVSDVIGQGILLSRCRNVTVSDNIVVGSGGAGIYLESSEQVLLTRNTVKYGVIGFAFYRSNHSLLEQNIALNNTNVGFEVIGVVNVSLISNVAFNGTYGWGFALSRSTKVMMYNNTAWNNANAGFLLSYTNQSILKRNVVKYNYEGFSFWDVTQLQLIENWAVWNHHSGFIFAGGMNDNNTLLDNIAFNNGGTGFDLGTFSNGILINNNATRNVGVGFFLGTGQNNFIANNTIVLNFSGMVLGDDSRRNNITNNDILFSTSFGIHVLDGRENQIIHNNFIYNNNGSVQGFCELPSNIFDHNFWSDHTIPDEDGDGIVDEPYPLEGSALSRDLHPLARPLPSPLINLPSKLSVSSPSDIILAEGKEGTINWDVQANNPLRYLVIRDTAVIIASGFSLGSTLVTITIGDLLPGTYLYQIEIFDVMGNSVIDEVFVTITRPKEGSFLGIISGFTTPILLLIIGTLSIYHARNLNKKR